MVQTNLIRGLLPEAYRVNCKADSKKGKQTQRTRHISHGAAFYPGNVAQPIYLCVLDEIFPKGVYLFRWHFFNRIIVSELRKP